jgi:hypothetical protein
MKRRDAETQGRRDAKLKRKTEKRKGKSMKHDDTRNPYRKKPQTIALQHPLRNGGIVGLVLLLLLLAAACGTTDQGASVEGTITINQTADVPVIETPDAGLEEAAADTLEETTVMENSAVVTSEKMAEDPNFVPEISDQEAMEWAETPLDTLYQNGEEYMNEVVRVQGYVVQKAGTNALLLGEASVSSDNDMLVIYQEDALTTEGNAMNADTVQNVIGIVREFNPSEFQQQAGFALDASASPIADFVGDEVIVAQRIWTEEGTSTVE